MVLFLSSFNFKYITLLHKRDFGSRFFKYVIQLVDLFASHSFFRISHSTGLVVGKFNIVFFRPRV